MKSSSVTLQAVTPKLTHYRAHGSTGASQQQPDTTRFRSVRLGLLGRWLFGFLAVSTFFGNLLLGLLTINLLFLALLIDHFLLFTLRIFTTILVQDRSPFSCCHWLCSILAGFFFMLLEVVPGLDESLCSALGPELLHHCFNV